MNGLPYYKAYPRDFIEGTIGMPFEIKGAYRIVLDLVYMQGGKLPDDARYISGLLGCTIRKWKSIRDELIKSGKLEVSGEFLENKRAVSELKILAKLQENQRENRSRPNKNNKLATPPTNHTEPEPDTKIEDTPSVVSSKRGTRLSPDWSPSAQNISYATSEGLVGEALAREADKFRDYWTAKSGQSAVKVDWDATWRNWVRTSVSRGPPRGGGGGKPRKTAYQEHQEACARELDKIINRDMEHDDGSSNIIDLGSADYRREGAARSRWG